MTEASAARTYDFPCDRRGAVVTGGTIGAVGDAVAGVAELAGVAGVASTLGRGLAGAAGAGTASVVCAPQCGQGMIKPVPAAGNSMGAPQWLQRHFRYFGSSMRCPRVDEKLPSPVNRRGHSTFAIW